MIANDKQIHNSMIKEKQQQHGFIIIISNNKCVSIPSKFRVDVFIITAYQLYLLNDIHQIRTSENL